MVTNSFGNRNFMQPMGRLSMHSWWALVFSFWGEVGWELFFVFLPCSISSPCISLGQKCWPTVLEIKNTCIQWVGWSMHSRCALIFYLLKFWVDGVWGGFFFILPLFPTCSLYVTFNFQVSSHQVLNMFPKFPNVFPKGVPNSTSLYPICFGQSAPLLTYIGGPKGEATHLSVEFFILREPS